MVGTRRKQEKEYSKLLLVCREESHIREQEYVETGQLWSLHGPAVAECSRYITFWPETAKAGFSMPLGLYWPDDIHAGQVSGTLSVFFPRAPTSGSSLASEIVTGVVQV
jgi:hypothetical protein